MTGHPLTCAGLALFTLGACGDASSGTDDVTTALSGGEMTIEDTSRDAYARPSPNLREEHRTLHFSGNAVFNRNWVTAPSSTTGLDGLGPTYNAASCSTCHFKDGRGAPPLAPNEPFSGLLVRLSIPGVDAHGGPLDEPSYGGQFNHRSILNVPAEGESHVTYEEVKGAFEDGTPYSLAKPTYTFTNLAFGPMAQGVMTSPRTAPGVFGLGLLESIAEADLIKNADPDDADGDGISGRPNRVWDKANGKVALGRFGWKANQPSLSQQNQGAFLGDMGITSPLFTGENCPSPQTVCAGAKSGGAPEIDEKKVEQVTLYTRTLAVPARRHVDDAQTKRGQTLFREIGCADCHVETFTTARDAVLPELENQRIHPYTDLLLHDMGKELADGRPDYLATGTEWRTPPLWGIGLVGTVNRHTRLLHDGRARDVNEAILWHGGEGEPARDGYRALAADERAALLAFLDSL